MSFPCTSCGACCALVRGRAKVLFDQKGWILPNGACKNYDPDTKLCRIYETRPAVCRVDSIRPETMTQQAWYDQVEMFCDDSHMLVYGTPRERKPVEKFKGDIGGLKVVLAIPSYGPIDPACQKDARVGIMVSAKYGASWEGDASPDKLGWAHGRNMIAQEVFESDNLEGGGVMWIDSDIRHKPHDIASLLASVHANGAQFVTGVYHQRKPIHNPVFYHFNKEKNLFQPFEEYPDNVFAPVDGCGFGFVYTSRDLIVRIAKHKKFDPKAGWFPDRRDVGGFGEDLSFCEQALWVGEQLFVNTAVQVGHTGDSKIIYKEDFLREKAAQVKVDAVVEKDWGVR